MTITQRQQDILEFIKEFSGKHSFSPTVREIGQGIGLQSPATVQRHLSRMRAKGVVDWQDATPRTIHILST